MLALSITQLSFPICRPCNRWPALQVLYSQILRFAVTFNSICSSVDLITILGKPCIWTLLILIISLLSIFYSCLNQWWELTQDSVIPTAAVSKIPRGRWLPLLLPPPHLFPLLWCLGFVLNVWEVVRNGYKLFAPASINICLFFLLINYGSPSSLQSQEDAQLEEAILRSIREQSGERGDGNNNETANDEASHQKDEGQPDVDWFVCIAFVSSKK